jgi:hypothetical protein
LGRPRLSAIRPVNRTGEEEESNNRRDRQYIAGEIR